MLETHVLGLIGEGMLMSGYKFIEAVLATRTVARIDPSVIWTSLEESIGYLCTVPG